MDDLVFRQRMEDSDLSPKGLKLSGSSGSFYVSVHLASYQPVLLVASSAPGHLVLVFKMPVIYMYPSWIHCFDATIDFSSSMSMLHLVSTIVSRGHRNYPGGQDYITDKSGHISEVDNPRIFAYPRQLSHDCLKTTLVNIVDSPTADCGLLEIGLRRHTVPLSENNTPMEYCSHSEGQCAIGAGLSRVGRSPRLDCQLC